MGISRSENMRRIRSKDTEPERAVRQLLRSLGFPGYRLHWKGAPGHPDVAFVGRRKAVMVHGCFWHGHCCKIGSREPKTNRDYWLPKIERNRQRDVKQLAELARLNWSVLTVWECELRDLDALSTRIAAFMIQTEDRAFNSTDEG
ncbi:TPA: DNA mismatch endonuclease Vsr [Pseudomonas aeruginosa]|uniref:very short patch repair endonuclease n=1 Tax=Pseudomonas aeruginosa TaxID=287 RepID=UPI00148B9435|nr:very short patch repair endonuclease [Pseudomonas aeruginosa]MBG6268787.1 DNA mismatch endonuclease Vsr [Pseudomonas aeruginosa]MBG6763736.1 DNA mismatch endonuclease Vsr [Pseudomonas aeruginosa]HBP5365761.1 DNA mismatch endonuclease Vsr [Pseudomonas aeruginosa]HBP6223049.1 DNA mismatch endonuclease Vsr [Pseudomonas aeruginosa]HBP6230256.1 DNA mismatch endonuclease Vsr [Pseudomonas aeruginosa]